MEPSSKFRTQALMLIPFYHRRKRLGAVFLVKYKGPQVSFRWHKHDDEAHRMFLCDALWKDCERLWIWCCFVLFICLFCFVLTWGKAGKRTESNIFLGRLETIKALGTKLPNAQDSLLSCLFSPRLCRSHRNRSWAFPFAMVNSHYPISLLKNKTLSSSCGLFCEGESALGIITRIFHPRFHSNVLMLKSS